MGIPLLIGTNKPGGRFMTSSARFAAFFSGTQRRPAALMTLLLLAMLQGAAANEPLRLDHVIERIDRLEFYRLADFGPPDSACHSCLTAQHVKCNSSCYTEIPSLSLICSLKVRGLSIGPFDREERNRILGELLLTDTVFMTTPAGEEALAAPRIVSAAGYEEDNYAIDIEGLDNGFKNTLIRASIADTPAQFSVRVGLQSYMVPVTAKVQDGLYRFLKQCPD